MNEDRRLSFGGMKRATTSAPDFANNRAYVIGVNAYSHGIPPLRTAVADAERLGELLRESHGYRVRCFPRDGAPSLAALRTLLEETLPQEVGPDDRVLFYFAGHGIALDGEDGPEGFLVPEDANREGRASFLPMTELSNALAGLPCRHLLLILDCCFAGAFRWSSTRALSALPPVIHRERYERYIQDPAWQVLTSAAYDQTALDVLSGKTIGERIETAKHSPFAAALFRALEGDADLIPRGKDGQPGGDGVITATELYLYLRERVETATVERRMRQTPGLWPLRKHDKGEYILLSPGHELNLPPAPELNFANNPYRGLQSFDEEHGHLFFGRTRLIDDLHSHVIANPLTIVVGASGTGKSSTVKAGLLPLLSRTDATSLNWHVLPVLRPGKTPVAALAELTLPGEIKKTISERLEDLMENHATLCDRLAEWSRYQPKNTRVLLVLDQLEELITLCRDEEQRRHFIDLLTRTSRSFPDLFRIVATLRSDFEPQFQEMGVHADWSAFRCLVPPMTREELRDAIEGPASLRVLYFQPSNLIDRLVDEVILMPGALPLLSFTLSELYVRYLKRRSDDRCLTEKDYESLGGVAGALSSRANELFHSLDPARQATMKRIMLRMVSSTGGELSRRRLTRSELRYGSAEEDDRVESVLSELREYRLIVQGRDADGEPYVEPAHDALLNSWGFLSLWVRGAGEQLTMRNALTPAAECWSQQQGGLWHHDPRLPVLQEQLTASNQLRSSSPVADAWLNDVEHRFVEASVRRRFWERLGFASIAILILLGVATGYFSVLREQKRTQTQLAQSQLESGVNAAVLDNHDEAIIRLFNGWELAEYAPDLRASARRLMEHWQNPYVGRLRHEYHLSAVMFHPDGQLVATGSLDGVVRFWDTETGSLLGGSQRLSGGIQTLRFSEDGNSIFAGTQVGVIRQLAVPSGHAIIEHQEFERNGRVLGFSSDCSRLITQTSQSVTVWDTRSGQQIVRKEHVDIDDAVFCYDDDAVVLSDDGVISLWDLNDNSITEKKGWTGGAQSYFMNTDYDRTRLVLRAAQLQSGRLDERYLSIVDLKTKSLVKTLYVGDELQTATISDLADFGLLTAEDGRSRLWNLKDEEIVGEILHGSALAISRRGDLAVIQGRTIDSLSSSFLIPSRGRLAWNKRGFGNDNYSMLLLAEDTTRAVEISSNAQTGKPEYLSVWSIGDERLVRTIQIKDEWTENVEISDDGRHIWIVSNDSFTIFQPDENRQDTISVPDLAAHCLLGDGKQLLTLDASGRGKIWNFSSKQPFELGNFGEGAVAVAACISCDICAIAYRDNEDWTFSQGTTIRSFRVSNTECLWEHTVDGGVIEIEIDPTGTYIALGRQQISSLLFDRVSGTTVAELSLAPNVSQIIFGKRGDTFATILPDTICLWDTKTGLQVCRIDTQDMMIDSAVFAEQDRTLFTTGLYGQLAHWSLSTDLPHSPDALYRTIQLQSGYSRDDSGNVQRLSHNRLFQLYNPMIAPTQDEAEP